MCTFYCTNTLNWPLNFEKKKGKKRYFTKVLTPFEIKVFLSTTNENFACNNPAASDSALKQWHTGIVRLTALKPNDVGGTSGKSYFRVTVPPFITTLLKWSGSICAHWCPLGFVLSNDLKDHLLTWYIITGYSHLVVVKCFRMFLAVQCIKKLDLPLEKWRKLLILSIDLESCHDSKSPFPSLSIMEKGNCTWLV